MVVMQENHVIDIFNTDKKNNIIYADPPWSYQQWSNTKQGAAKAHYPTMKQKDIEALPINEIAADNSILFVGNFPEAARGFRYHKSVGVCL